MGIVNDFEMNGNFQFLGQRTDPLPIPAGAVGTKNDMLGRGGIQLPEIAFDQFEYPIDIAHGGIIDREKVGTLASIGFKALDHDLGRLTPIGTVASPFGACRRSAAFGFPLPQVTAVEANQQHTAIDPVGSAQSDTLAMVHGLPTHRPADALNGLDSQFDAMLGKGLSGNLKGRAQQGRLDRRGCQVQADPIDESQPLQGQLTVEIAPASILRQSLDEIRNPQADGVAGEHAHTDFSIAMEAQRFFRRDGFKFNEKLRAVEQPLNDGGYQRFDKFGQLAVQRLDQAVDIGVVVEIGYRFFDRVCETMQFG